MADKHYRSLVKAVSWRCTGSVDTMIITFLITHQISLTSPNSHKKPIKAHLCSK
jgi:hypothetical protein